MEAESNILEYHDGFAEHNQVQSTLLYDRRSGRDVVITIAIPTFRRLALLKQAVASAVAQNTVATFQILIVDNDHESDGHEILAYLSALDVPDLRYFRNDQNIGMFGNWNRCITLAEGEWITILNDDDLLAPGFLSQCLHHISQRPSINMIACSILTRDERKDVYSGSFDRIRNAINGYRKLTKAGKLKRLKVEHYFLHNPHHGSLGILVRTVRCRESGGFNSNKYPSADYYFYCSIALLAEAYFLNTPLASYRVLENESKNASVAVGWVEQGLQLRRHLSKYMTQPLWLLNGYSNLMAIHTARYCKVYWGSNLDVKKTLRRVGLPNVPVYALLLVWRALLRRWPKGWRVRQ